MFSAASKTDNVSSAANYIEDVFSTYLYTGNGSSQTITNGIDFSGKGGMLWIKARSAATGSVLFDTTRGFGNYLSSDAPDQQNWAGSLGWTSGSFNSNGFTTVQGTNGSINGNGVTFASWAFREQPKFFDVVTYTGNGANRTIAHNLGSVPGCIIVKRTDTTADWQAYHRSLANTEYMVLNTTAAKATGATRWNSTTPTSTEFSLGTDATVNANGGTYVAYLFAHDAGGFGTAGTDNVISCGSYTGTSAAGNFVNLGYEPQFVMIKNATGSGTYWGMWDNMRGIVTGGADPELYANTSNAENGVWGSLNWLDVNATGFTPDPTGGGYGDVNASGSTYIYIAIRRGPMKTPTSGTSVLTVYTAASTAANQVIGTIPVDLSIVKQRTETNPDFVWDRLRGSTPYLITSSTNAEANANYAGFDQSNGYREKSGFSANPMYWLMARAPSFMDVVCYTGDGATGAGSYRILSHNLSAIPELVIIKPRSSTGNWIVTSAFNSTSYSYGMKLNLTDAQSGAWNPVGTGYFTSTQFTTYIGNIQSETNSSGVTYVAYLFASCPGVSKVGSYSGTGGTQTISCGFAARFVMIKRTDSTGDWWVWDTARGMVAGTDPRIPWSTATTETNANWVYTDASGFQIVTTDATVNASGGSYIFLAVA